MSPLFATISHRYDRPVKMGLQYEVIPKGKTFTGTYRRDPIPFPTAIIYSENICDPCIKGTSISPQFHWDFSSTALYCQNIWNAHFH